jgi:aryl-alcohol dehydrogenase-like predicted oxidoreductase
VLVEQAAPAATLGRFGHDLRNVAVAPGSQQLLADLGVWDRVASAPYRTMRIWDERGAATMVFDAAEVGRQELGWMLENGPTLESLWAMLARQVAAGKIRFLGISLSSNLDPAHQVARAREVGASTIQVVYNRLNRRPEETVFPSCLEQDLGVLARIPLASGFLSGKYQPGAQFTAEDDLRSGWDPAHIEERLRQVQEIQQKEVPSGVPMAPWALAWCLRHAAVTCVIPGCKSVEQVESNARAAELDLDTL